MRIQHNIMAMNSYRNYTGNTSALAKNLEKLSSGFKINRAGDDAAGLAISEKMRAQVTGLKTAQKNAKDGISLVQTAEGALTEVHSMLNRMVELADQSANGTYDNATDRANLQKEFDALRTEIDRIADSSNFNGIKLLDGSLSSGGGSGSASVPGIKGLETSTVAATKYTGQTADFATDTATAADGGLMQMTINYTDAKGKAQSVTVNLKLDTTNHKLIADNGDEYAIADTTNNQATKGELQDAFLKELGKTDLGKTFKMDKSGDAIQFDAVDKGANVKIDSILSYLKGDKTTAATLDAAVAKQTLQYVTAGADAYEQIDMAANYTLGDTFSVGGKQFAFVGTQEDAVALGSSVNSIVIAGGAGGTVANADITDMAALIEQKTGYKPADDGGTVFQFKAPTGSKAIQGKGLTLQIGDTAEDFNQLTVSVNDMHAKALGISGISIADQASAKNAVESIKTAINSVSSTRGDLGALQNRLDHTINNLAVMQENIQDAEASIRDVDVAEEMMSYTKNNILVQSAQAMLAQANQVPQGVLQLLQ